MSEQPVPIQYFPDAQGTFQIPPLASGNAFLGDITGAPTSTESPVSCGLFRMTAGEPLVGNYPYQETLIVLEGSFNIKDGAGNESVGKKGDVYYFPAGSTVTFSTEKEGLAFYSVQRAKK